LLCERITVAKFKEVKAGWSKTNLVESSKEDWLKRALFQDDDDDDDDNCIVLGCDSVQFGRYNVLDEPIAYVFSG
jgi:hypothetical protein